MRSLVESILDRKNKTKTLSGNDVLKAWCLEHPDAVGDHEVNDLYNIEGKTLVLSRPGSGYGMTYSLELIDYVQKALKINKIIVRTGGNIEFIADGKTPVDFIGWEVECGRANFRFGNVGKVKNCKISAGMIRVDNSTLRTNTKPATYENVEFNGDVWVPVEISKWPELKNCKISTPVIWQTPHTDDWKAMTKKDAESFRDDVFDKIGFDCFTITYYKGPTKHMMIWKTDGDFTPIPNAYKIRKVGKYTYWKS